jgi:(p)ppGpp synthase/HD superfamily hydrolase
LCRAAFFHTKSTERPEGVGKMMMERESLLRQHEPELAEQLSGCLQRRDYWLFEAAYEFAYKVHEGKDRESGDPFISHPVAVVKILLAWGLCRPAVLIAAILHDTVEEQRKRGRCNLVVPQTDHAGATWFLAHVWGKEAAELIMLVTMADWMDKDHGLLVADLIHHGDFYASALKLADRLHNTVTLWACDPAKRFRKARETLDFYPDLLAATLRRSPNEYRSAIEQDGHRILAIAQHYLEQPDQELGEVAV